MNPWAVRTFEDLLAPVIAGLSDYTRNFYRHDHLGPGGDREKITTARVVVMVGPEPKDIGLPSGPASDQVFVNTTELSVYVETPLLLTSGAGKEIKGKNNVHDPTCATIRSWLEDNREGLEVPADLIAKGCPQIVYGMLTPNPQEKGSGVVNNLYWRHVFFAILQNMEVT